MGDLFIFAAKLASEVFTDPRKLGDTFDRVVKHAEELSK